MTDGTVSSFNAGLWLLILAGLATVMLGSLLLIKNDYRLVAKLLLCAMAIPGLLFGIFTLMLMGVKDWK